ncbi:DNA dependent RNA polymerase D largest subunit [Dorcoceras hygrometricum]|uniref:DNA dependent RNA polymerase D largest subunit n=1 Tax=Dorcoceras hygrometricum TaxID=472368 RepID=A0A2Z7C328_9LAMI|nr:DNA dependent RNA polymerase D largest subunit [Dorcoceras hygrometricum]
MIDVLGVAIRFVQVLESAVLSYQMSRRRCLVSDVGSALVIAFRCCVAYQLRSARRQLEGQRG